MLIPDNRCASTLASRILPAGADKTAWLILASRGLRGFCDGFIAVLLPAYLLSLGLSQLEVGLIGTTTLAGSAIATIAIGMLASRFTQRRMLTLAAALMAATGIGFASFSTLWPLVVVAFAGTLNPSSGDVSLFLPLEQSRLAQAADGDARTALFARYSLVGAVSGAVGSLAAGLPIVVASHTRITTLGAMRGMFLVYAAAGIVVCMLYRRLPRPETHATKNATLPLGPSRPIVIRLTMLFSVDAFAGGLVVNSLLSLWLMQRFGLSIAAAGRFFFWAGLLSAGSQLAAAPLARRIGLLNTMVFTHIPSSICLIGAALAPSLPLTLTLLLMRSALSQMDVPTRTAYVMAVVTPAERPAAASFTSVPRSLAAALAPTLAGGLFGLGWLGAPLVACGALKIAYDLSMLLAFRHVRPDDGRAR
ncbi:ABC transporter permease [Burkholderia diffusa]|uniref:ABC transporter permease n=1 Tax=Burkholderia diffusa TaxID=488732 RepID=A0AAW3PGE2_9BURK|nr:ABC transporter permease [Burkholderia diffusa]KWF33234.1 ABC transporter permease [Burkholderia diffusa]KWF46092.1 ABC transporter permease [Burkholderia diffusa]KWF52855.1 ABC transporter permease [Burkholderia diffusa]